VPGLVLGTFRLGDYNYVSCVTSCSLFDRGTAYSRKRQVLKGRAGRGPTGQSHAAEGVRRHPDAQFATGSKKLKITLKVELLTEKKDIEELASNGNRFSSTNTPNSLGATTGGSSTRHQRTIPSRRSIRTKKKSGNGGHVGSRRRKFWLVASIGTLRIKRGEGWRRGIHKTSHSGVRGTVCGARNQVHREIGTLDTRKSQGVGRMMFRKKRVSTAIFLELKI